MNQPPVKKLLQTAIDSADARGAKFELEWIQQLRQLVESLPLSPEDYRLVSRRLDNSEEYARSGQLSAARFEVKHVVATLKNVFSLKSLLGLWVKSK